MICETLLRQREDSIREEYDKVLHEKLQGMTHTMTHYDSSNDVIIQNNTKFGVATTRISFNSTSQVQVQITFPNMEIKKKMFRN